MRFDVLTLFPELIQTAMGHSILGRAQVNELIHINAVNIRDYSDNKHRKVDDYPYGGGNGMVMTPQPIYNAYMSVTETLDYKPKTIYLSPQGKIFNQTLAKEFLTCGHLILLCGHYEGVDERIIEEIVDEEISIGDYVLTGGEIPAMVLIECVSRLVPGVLGNEGSFSEESHYHGLLEYPQYTRPPEFKGRPIPEVLLSGHHLNITRWRKQQSLRRTLKKRPDLLENYPLSDEEKKLLNSPDII